MRRTLDGILYCHTFAPGALGFPVADELTRFQLCVDERAVGLVAARARPWHACNRVEVFDAPVASALRDALCAFRSRQDLQVLDVVGSFFRVVALVHQQLGHTSRVVGELALCRDVLHLQVNVSLDGVFDDFDTCVVLPSL